MKKKMLVKFIAGLSIVSIAFTGFPLNLFIHHKSGTEILENIVLADEINPGIPELPTDMDLEKMADEKIAEYSQEEKAFQSEAVEAFSDYNTQEFDVQKMTDEQEAVLTDLIVKEAEKIDLPTKEDKESYVQVMLDFYDSSSDNYQDIKATTETLVEEIDENHSSPLDPVSGEKVLAASHGWVSTALLASVVNTTINLMLIGAGVGSVWVFIKKRGVSFVRNYFKSRVKARLVAWFGSAIGVYATYVWDFVMASVDPGGAFARWLDYRDRKPRNGWIELW